MQSVRDTASELVDSAMSFLGVPYRRGATNNSDGFDCSSFTRHIFETSLGLVLPRSAHEQASADALTKVQRTELSRVIWCFSTPCGAPSLTWESTWATTSSSMRPDQARWFALKTCANPIGLAGSPARVASSLLPRHPRPIKRLAIGVAIDMDAAASWHRGTMAPMGETVIPLADLRYTAQVPDHPSAG
jgi:hypothetical protein